MASPVTILPLTGELTLSTIEATEDRILPYTTRENTHLVLDLAGLTMMTTPGIGLLLELHKKTTRAGGSFTLANPTPYIADLLRRTQLHKVFTITPALHATPAPEPSSRP